MILENFKLTLGGFFCFFFHFDFGSMFWICEHFLCGEYSAQTAFPNNFQEFIIYIELNSKYKALKIK